MTRPLTVAEIFDRAVTLLVRRWRAAVLIALVVSVPQALNAALVGGSPRAAVHFAAVVFLLALAAGLLYLYGFAALVMLFAGERDDANAFALVGEAFHEFWRLLRVSLATTFLIAGGGAAVLAVGFLIASVTGPTGSVLFFAIAAVAAVPLFFTLEIALCDAVLEGTGATVSIGTAFRRLLARGARVRTALLAYAVALCYFAPRFVLGAAAALIVTATHQAWLTVIAAPLEAIAGLVFFAAVTTVAAVDYRVRSEGADLEAALALPETA